MMETTDDKLLKSFFAENKKEIEDKGFSRRVMHHLPDRYYRLAQLWSVLSFVLAAILFVLLDGIELVMNTLREIFSNTIASGIAEIDIKTLILIIGVIFYLTFNKIKTLA